MPGNNNPCDICGADREDDGVCLHCDWNAMPDSEWGYQGFFEEWLENMEVTRTKDADSLAVGDLDAGILEPTATAMDERPNQDEINNEVDLAGGAGNLPSPALTLPTIDKHELDEHQPDDDRPHDDFVSWDEVAGAFNNTPVSQVAHGFNYPQANGQEYGRLQTGPGLRPVATTNPARNHILQGQNVGMTYENFIGNYGQFDRNTGTLNQLSYDFQGDQLTPHNPNNAPLGPSRLHLASQTPAQFPQGYHNPHLSTNLNWPAQNYGVPMSAFNPGMAPDQSTQLPLGSPQAAQHPLGHGTFFITHDLPYIAPGQGFLDDPLSQLAPAAPAAPRGAPIPPFQRPYNLDLPQGLLPVPSQGHKYHKEEDEEEENDRSPTKKQRPNPNNPNSGKGKGTGKKGDLGRRGLQNAQLHATGLCIWCKQANPDLRHKGCPKCLPGRAARTARWRKEKARKAAGEGRDGHGGVGAGGE